MLSCSFHTQLNTSAEKTLFVYWTSHTPRRKEKGKQEDIPCSTDTYTQELNADKKEGRQPGRPAP